MAFCVLVSLSGVQLYLQEIGEAQQAVFSRIFVANLIASLPWVPLGMGVLSLTRRLPPRGGRALMVHALVSVAVATAFLSWLALFHAAVLPWVVRTSAAGSFLSWLRHDLEEFFTLALLIYWAVVAASLAARSWSHPSPRSASASRQFAEEDREQAATDPPPPLLIRSHGRTRVVDPSRVAWVEAAGSYVKLHAEGKSHLLRRSLSELADQLAGAGFARIHRSTLVRLDQIEEVLRQSHGDAIVVLRGGHRLRVSRTYRHSLSSLRR